MSVRIVCGNCGKAATLNDYDQASRVLCANCGRPLENEPSLKLRTKGLSDDDIMGFLMPSRLRKGSAT